MTKAIKYIPEVSGDSRKTNYPISPERASLYKCYTEQVANFWTIGEVSLQYDREHYEQKLTPGEKHFVNYILAFFASADKLVNDNLNQSFMREVNIPEAQWFWGIQTAIETIHGEMYSLLLNTIILDPQLQSELINATEEIPVIGDMTRYIEATTDSNAPFPERILRMACVEGLFFTGCFAAIYWLAEKGYMPGLTQSNEMIARDETLHTKFSLLLYSLVDPQYRASQEKAWEIIGGAVDIAVSFIKGAIPEPLERMNAHLMEKHIKSQADKMLTGIGYSPLYGVDVRLPYMEVYSMKINTSTFERKNTNYQKPVLSPEFLHIIYGKKEDAPAGGASYDPDF